MKMKLRKNDRSYTVITEDDLGPPLTNAQRRTLREGVDEIPARIRCGRWHAKELLKYLRGEE